MQCAFCTHNTPALGMLSYVTVRNDFGLTSALYVDYNKHNAMEDVACR